MAGWTLFPHFIVRATGFPFELVERLRCADLMGSARAVERLERELQAVRSSAPRIKGMSKAVLSAIKAGRPVPLDQVEQPQLFEEWNRVATALASAHEAFAEAEKRELPRAQAALREISSDIRFQEAVASSSPPVLDDILKARWNNRLERQVASYVQRVSAKNETMSFFGPINYGALEPEKPTGVGFEWSGPLKLTGRRTHAAYWLVQGVAEHIAFDPEVAPWLVLRPKSFAEPPIPRKRPKLGEILVEQRLLTPDQLGRALERQTVDARKLGEILVEADLCARQAVEDAVRSQATLSQVDAEGDLLHRLVSMSNGARSLRAIARDIGVSVDRLLAPLKLACGKKLLTHQLEIPSSLPLPLVDLVDRLAGIPGPAVRRHIEGVTEILNRMHRYSAGDATGKVQQNESLRQFVEQRWGVRPPVTPKPVEKPAPPTASGQVVQRRGEGHHFYVDRLPMREECAGDLRLHLCGERARELASELDRPLDLLGHAARRTRQMARERLGSLLGKRTLPLWKVVAAYSDRSVPYDDSLSEWMVRSLVGRDQLPRVELADEGLPPPPPEDGLPLICSVDLLIGATDTAAWGRGDYDLVMGDIHDTALVWGWALQFHEQRAHVEAEMIRALGSLDRPLPIISLLASRRTGLLPSEFPGAVVQVGGVSGKPAGWQLPFDDLVVESDGTVARLVSRSLASEVCIYNGELESLVHTAFALPRIRPPRVNIGAHTPRLSFGKVVLQREQWRLEEPQVQSLLEASGDLERLRCAARLWEELKLPDVVFAKLPNERKPILVDPASPLNLRVLTNLIEHRGGALFSEMLPAPHQLWLKDPNGRHTTELRCTYLKSGGQ